MGNRPDRVLRDLNANENYRRLFADAFETPTIELEQVYTALTAFEASLVSLNSRYDFYAHGIHSALAPSELEGIKATIDESLIGGLIVKVGSKMIDSSIKSKLSNLQNVMKEVG